MGVCGMSATSRFSRCAPSSYAGAGQPQDRPRNVTFPRRSSSYKGIQFNPGPLRRHRLRPVPKKSKMKFPFFLLVLLIVCLPVYAQTASLKGQVMDETGAVVPGAAITVAGPNGITKSTTAQSDGSYSFVGLPPGKYTVRVSAPDLSQSQPVNAVLQSGSQSLDLRMKVASVTQQVTVEDSAGPNVSVDPSSNSTATILRGDDLQALSDDPDDLQSDLQALAGPSAGPEGGEIYIDGFSGGQLPSKDSIREVRVNQNPFSPEYSKLGYGRIDILTKPGTDKLHGNAFFNFGDSVWNSRNPYAQQKAPFLLQESGVNGSGPLGGRASFFLDLQRHSIANGAIINGSTLDPATLAIIDPYTDVLRIPQHRQIINPRLDYRLSENHTLTVRYGFTHADVRDSGVGSFFLQSRGVHAASTSQTAQVTETAVHGPVVNEVRFQFYLTDSSNLANSLTPAIQALAAFSGGGSPVGDAFNTQNSYELQNYTSVTRAAHSWKVGVRLRAQHIDDISPQNFNGTFTFSGGLAPQLDANNQPVLDADGAPVLAHITSIESYRRTLLFQQAGLPAVQVRALGGGASQFTISAGQPGLSAGQVDGAAFAGDDWRLRPNLTLSLGLRYETQSNIHDWRDFAPRVAVAWAPGAKSSKGGGKTVIRAGFGMFYDRFILGNTIAARRYNGIVQQQYVVTNPVFFPEIPPVSVLAALGSPVATQRVAAELRAPYLMQSTLSVERQLTHTTTLAVTYANSHGLHIDRKSVV